MSDHQTVRVKRTTTRPSFLLPITEPKRDPDVSAMLEGYGAMEGGITRVSAVLPYYSYTVLLWCYTVVLIYCCFKVLLLLWY